MNAFAFRFACCLALMSVFSTTISLPLALYNGDSYVPASVVDTGITNTCAVELVASDTALRCWGKNDYGQSNPPKERNSFLRVSVGVDYGCATRTNLSIVCWGNLNTPERSPPRGEFLVISTKTQHNCGVRLDNTIVCWGRNLYGETVVPSGLSAPDVSVGDTHSCAVTVFEGKIVCWGSNFYGESSPPSDSGFYQIAAGFQHTCALHQNGTVVCFGLNTDGQASPPARSFIQVSSGANHSCGRLEDSTAICWGSNRCPDGRVCNQLQIPTDQTYVSVNAGAYYTCGVNTRGGKVNCWGLNDDGQTTVPFY